MALLYAKKHKDLANDKHQIFSWPMAYISIRF